MEELWRKCEEIWRNYKENKWRKYMKKIWKKYEGTMKKIWRNMKELWRIYEVIWSNMKELWRIYEEIWRTFEELCGKYENKDSPYRPWNLEKFQAHPLISGGVGGGWFAIFKFRGTPEKRHETCQYERICGK